MSRVSGYGNPFKKQGVMPQEQVKEQPKVVGDKVEEEVKTNTPTRTVTYAASTKVPASSQEGEERTVSSGSCATASASNSLGGDVSKPTSGDGSLSNPYVISGWLLGETLLYFMDLASQKGDYVYVKAEGSVWRVSVNGASSGMWG